uniref:Uncharacterized protein n=1 Tax=Globodera rostochiensis TaxID=31243 RepID=A0A914HKF0_GLORO
MRQRRRKRSDVNPTIIHGDSSESSSRRKTGCALSVTLGIMFFLTGIASQIHSELEEWKTLCQKLEKWETSSDLYVTMVLNWHTTTLDHPGIISAINGALNGLLEKVNEFPQKDEMDELLKRRLLEPLAIAIGNCDKLLNNGVGLEKDKKYLENLLSKIRSIAKGLRTEFNTFIFEVQLELIKKFETWSRALLWILGNQFPQYRLGTEELVDFVEALTIHAKLIILETELPTKIAVFAEQHPHIDGDGFLAFFHKFKPDWIQIEQRIDQLKRLDYIEKIHFPERLDYLAKSVIEKADHLTDLITLKLDQLVTKCYNAKLKGSSKNPIKGLLRPLKSERKMHQLPIDAKNKKIYAMMAILNDIGMFDCAAFNVLVCFERDLDNTDFSCDELETAVKQDKEMVAKAYQLKGKDLVDE